MQQILLDNKAKGLSPIATPYVIQAMDLMKDECIMFAKS